MIDNTSNELISDEVSNELSIGNDGSLTPVKLKVQYDSDVPDMVDVVKLVKPLTKKKKPRKKRT